MKKTIFHNTVIDQCNVCGSIWLDKNQLEKILFNCSKKSLRQLQKEIEFEKKYQRNLTVCGICPKCNTKKLDKIQINGITIDKCLYCNGLFFDYKELNKIIEIQKNKFFLFRFFKKIKYILFH